MAMFNSGACDSPISDFFRGKCVLLTGCTGFLGHLYLEKLLRLEAKLIYVLIRPKRTVSCEKRLKKILRSPIFAELLQKNPNLCDRICILNGKLAAPNLDISDQNVLSDLIETTEIVVHSAAQVSFSASVFEAIETNVYGTFQLLQLCVQMRHLSAFLYVSTAYSQAHHDHPAEQFYKPVVDPMLLIRCYEQFGINSTDENVKNAFEVIMMKMRLQSRAITYAMSKNAAEALVQSYGDYFPIAVIRPSIVVSTLRDPIPGWIHGFQLPLLLISAIMTGFIHTMYLKRTRWNAVSGDMVINASLAVIWHTAVEYKRTGMLQAKVYHLTNQTKDALAYGDHICKYIEKDGQRYSTLKCIWYPTLTTTKCKWHYGLCQLFYQIIPSAIIDLIGPNKPISCMKISRMIANTPTLDNDTKDYTFSSKMIDGIWSSMNENDRRSFNFDTTSIDWKSYLSLLAMSVRTYTLNQTPEQLKAAEKQFHYFKFLHFAVKYFFWIVIFSIFWCAFSAYLMRNG